MNKTAANDELFTKAPILKAVLSLAVPTVISQLIYIIYNMADTFFIGRLNNPDQVAAATVALPLFAFLTVIANLFGIGGACVISRALGRNDIDRATKASAFSICTAIVTAFIFGTVIFAVKGVLLPVIGADSASYKYCVDYVFWTITIGAIPTVMNNCFAHLVRSEGYSKQAALGIAFGGVLNMALDPLFIFIFDLEIKGAAIATMISNSAAMIYFIILITKIKDKTVISLNPKYYSARNGIGKEVFFGGLPSSLMAVMSSLSMSTLNSLMKPYSNEAIAGFGIAKKIDGIAYAIAQGISQGALPIIAFNYSANDKQRLKQSIGVTFLYSMLMSVVGLIVLYVFAVPISASFIKDAATIDFAGRFLKILAFACPLTAVNFMVITIFQATGSKVQSIVLSVLRKGGMDIPLMFILNHYWKVNAIPLATPLAEIIGLCVAVCMLIPFLRKLGVARSISIS